MDNYKNFAVSTVTTPPSPATSGTTLTLATGTGSRFPMGSFDVTLYAPGTEPDITNAEIARASVSGDTMTFSARGAYGTTAQSVAAGWIVDNAVTANFIGQIVSAIPAASSTTTGPDTFAAASSPGSATTFARGDHDHGLPADPTTAFASAVATLTNKRITRRVLALSSNAATYTVNTDSYDTVHITAQAQNLTSFTVSGTPQDGDTLRMSVTATGAYTLAFGTSFEASGVALPTAIGTTRLDMEFEWNTATSKWRIVRASQSSGGGGALSYASSYLTTNPSLSANAATTLTSVALAAGTWLIQAQACILNSSSTSNGEIDLWVGPNSASQVGAYAGSFATYGEAAATHDGGAEVSLLCVVVLASPATVYLVAGPTTNVSVLHISQGWSTPNATGMTCVKIA